MYKTIHNHATGKHVPISAYVASRQKVKPEEEELLVKLIVERAYKGMGMTHREIEEAADEIIRARLGEELFEVNPKEAVGKFWIYSFLNRWDDRLQTGWSRPLDTQRARSLCPEKVKHWFDLVKEQVVDKDIKPENIYGMDESGFPFTDQGVQRVVRTQQ